MKKILIALFTVVLAVCMFIPTAFAETLGTLNYSVSAASVNLTAAGAGRFTITVPDTTGTPYNGVQYQLKLPQGAVINSVNYDNTAASKLDPQRPNGGQTQDTYIFSCYVLALENKLTGALTCTVDVTYNGSTEQDLTIVEIIKSAVNGNKTEDYISNSSTNIKLIPYNSGGGQPSSTDASLSAMSLSSGTLNPAFSSSVTNYTATVANNVSSVNVYATANHPNAKVNNPGTFSLNVGANTLTVTVTAEDGVTKRDYRIVVTRQGSGGGESVKSTDASLSSLTLSSGTLSPAFNSSVTNYTATVANSVSSVIVYAAANHGSATVNNPGTFSLNVGANTLTVTVTAEDGVTKRDYRIVVTRQNLGDVSPPGTGSPSTGTNNPSAGAGNLPGAGGATITDSQVPLSSLGKPEPILDKSGLKGYIAGYPDKTVRAANSITRYEAAVIFYNLVSNGDKASYVSGVSRFSDVSGDMWYSAAVGYLVAAEVLTGYPDGTFKGNNLITRAEFVTIATKFIKSDPAAGDISFLDVTEDHWAYGFIRSAFNNGLIMGYPDGTFGPEISIARAEVFVIVNKLLGWDASSVASVKLDFTDVTGSEWYYNDIVLAVNGKQS